MGDSLEGVEVKEYSRKLYKLWSLRFSNSLEGVEVQGDIGNYLFYFLDIIDVNGEKVVPLLCTPCSNSYQVRYFDKMTLFKSFFKRSPSL